MRHALVAALICSCAGTTIAAAAADEKPRYFGNWRVETFQDKFTDDNNASVATISDGNILAFRCLAKEYSIVFLSESLNMKENDKFHFKVRVDKNPVIDLDGQAINDKGLIGIDPSIPVAQVAMAKEIAIRVEDSSGNTFDVTYNLSHSKEAALCRKRNKHHP